MQDVPFKYPRAAVGYIFGVSALVFGVAGWIVGRGHELITPTLELLALVYGVIAAAYFLLSVYNMHRILQQATNRKYPVGPLKAAGLNLIPFYNLYWSFKWTGEIASFLNRVKREDRFGIDRCGWALLFGFFPGCLIPGLPQIVGFYVIGYLVKHLEITLAAHTLPIESYEKESYKSMAGAAAASIVSVFVLLLVGIVVSGAFIKGRSAAIINLQQHTAGGVNQ